MLGDRFKILGSSQYTTMSNSDRKLSHVTFQLGVGLDFGENDYDASKNLKNPNNDKQQHSKGFIEFH